MADIKYGFSQPPPEDPDGTPFVRATDISGGKIDRSTIRHVDASKVQLSNGVVLRAGDILVVRSGAYTADSAIIPSDLVGALAGYDMVVRPEGIDPRYLGWSLLSGYVLNAQLKTKTGRAAQPHLNAEDLGDTRILLPPATEQRRISDYLREKTSKIDRLIAKKERLIELLQERRTALVTEAVTKGLDPDSSMKDSGVEWLGEIPEHWDVVRLKMRAEIQTGLTLGKNYSGPTEERPYLRVANVQDGYLDLSDISTVEVSRTKSETTELRPGDVLMTEGGDFDKLGRGYVWEGQVEECLHQNHIFAIRPRGQHLNPDFLSYLTTSLYGRAYFSATAKQSTNLASTNRRKVGDFPIPLPPLEEQARVVRMLNREDAKVRNLQERIKEAVSSLHEYRSALITAAVTGKIDVRDHAA